MTGSLLRAVKFSQKGIALCSLFLGSISSTLAAQVDSTPQVQSSSAALKTTGALFQRENLQSIRLSRQPEGYFRGHGFRFALDLGYVNQNSSVYVDGFNPELHHCCVSTSVLDGKLQTCQFRELYSQKEFSQAIKGKFKFGWAFFDRVKNMGFFQLEVSTRLPQLKKMGLCSKWSPRPNLCPSLQWRHFLPNGHTFTLGAHGLIGFEKTSLLCQEKKATEKIDTLVKGGVHFDFLWKERGRIFGLLSLNFLPFIAHDLPSQDGAYVKTERKNYFKNSNLLKLGGTLPLSIFSHLFLPQFFKNLWWMDAFFEFKHDQSGLILNPKEKNEDQKRFSALASRKSGLKKGLKFFILSCFQISLGLDSSEKADQIASELVKDFLVGLFLGRFFCNLNFLYRSDLDLMNQCSFQAKKNCHLSHYPCNRADLIDYFETDRLRFYQEDCMVGSKKSTT